MAGALVGILKPGRMSMFGSLLIIWGLVKEGILGKPVNPEPALMMNILFKDCKKKSSIRLMCGREIG